MVPPRASSPDPVDAAAPTGSPAEHHVARTRTLLREAVAEASHLPPLQVVRRHADCVEEILCELEVEGARYVLSRLQTRHPTASLSRREREIAWLIAQGFPTKAIGVALHISTWTVVTYLRRIYTRFGVRNRAAMVARLLEEGLLPLEKPEAR